jgi:HEAT repeat protein
LLIAVGVLLVAELIYSTYRWKEPSYHGMRLKIWLMNYDRRGDSAETDEAVRQMGTRCLPFMLEMLSVQDGRGRETLADVTDQLGIRSSQYYPAVQQHRWALGGFRALGPMAAPAVPELVKMLQRPGLQRDAGLALGAVGSPAMPALVKELSANDPLARAGAVVALGECFNPGLGEYRDAAEIEAVRAKGREVLPAMVRCLDDADPRVRSSALNALGGIEVEQETIIAALVKASADSIPDVRRAALIALARQGGAAAGVVPLLVEKMKDPDRGVAAGAAFAIRMIAPDRAEELGAR